MPENFQTVSLRILVNKGARTLSHTRPPGGEGVVGGGVAQPGEARAVRVHHVDLGVVLDALGGEGDPRAVGDHVGGQWSLPGMSVRRVRLEPSILTV